MAQLVVTTSESSGQKFLWGNSYPNYNDAHDDGGWIVGTDNTRISLGQTLFLDPTNYDIRRFGWIFDTSTLPTTAVIYSAFISFKVWREPIGRDFDITLVSGVDIADDGLVVADFGDLLDDTISRGSLSTSGLADETWYDINLNYIGRGEISRGGVTKFGVRCSLDIDGSAPTIRSDLAYFHSSEDNEVKLTINYFSAPGYVWTEGDKFHFIPEMLATNRAGEQELLGADTTTDATAGHLFVEGDYLHFVSQNGDERRQLGKDTLANASAGSEGQMWLDDMWIFYVDSSLNVRKLGTWMIGGSTLGVDTILHA